MHPLQFAVVVAALIYSVGVRAEDMRKDIETNNAGLAADILRGDARAVAERYTPDAAILPPGGKIARGTAAIEAFWTAAITAGIEDVELTTTSVEGAGDLAFEEGTMATTDGDGRTKQQHYIVVWKRVGGEWKLHRDIWN